MSTDPNNNASFLNRLRNTYRLVIFNNETFEEIRSFQLTLRNFYALVSSIIVFVAICIVLLIFFTPLKTLVPGYGELEDNSMFITLNEKLDEIDKSINAQEIYMSSFRRMLTADEEVSEKQKSKEQELKSAIEEAQKTNEKLSPKPASSTPIRPQSKPVDGGLGMEYLFPPVQGPVSAGFMPDKKHFGVDVLGNENSPVNAIKEGFVIISGWDLKTGNTIGIQHDNNLISFYKHNSVLLKEEGSYVRAGEAIAIIGNSGTLSDGPHLHFELWHQGNPLDPKNYINFN